MGKRKTAQRGPAAKKPPESKRRWIILNAKTRQPLLGQTDEGISDETRAHRLSDGYLVDTIVVPLWEWKGEPDPDEADE